MIRLRILFQTQPALLNSSLILRCTFNIYTGILLYQPIEVRFNAPMILWRFIGLISFSPIIILQPISSLIGRRLLWQVGTTRS
jgi:hypothetical protein